MDDTIKRECEARGWENVYRAFLPEGAVLTGGGHSGERLTRSPFPGSTDRSPSLSINTISGFWHDWHMADRIPLPRGRNGGTGGNIVQFVTFVRHSRVDARGVLLPDYGAGERELRLWLGLTTGIDVAWYQACRSRLSQADSPYHAEWMPFKPWSVRAINLYGVGWCTEARRIVFPVNDMQGNLVNAKMYRPGPGPGPKTYWKVEGVGPQNLPFPSVIAWERQMPFFFVEGEGDALTLASIGLPGVCGTMGASNPVPWLGLAGAEWVSGRDVTICMDADTAGERAASLAVVAFQPYASSLRRLHVPEWPGNPLKRDISDYVTHLLRQADDDRDRVRTVISTAAAQCEPLGAEVTYEAEPTEASFDEALEPNKFGIRIEADVRVISKAQSQHLIPSSVQFSCGEGHTYCRRCPMVGRGGTWRRTIDHRSATVLAMVTSDDDKVRKAAIKHFGIVEQCPDVKMKTMSVMDAQIIQIGPPQTSGRHMVSADDANARRTEAFVVSAEGGAIEPGYDYKMRGFVYPLTKNQKAVLLIDRATILSSRGERMPFNDDEIEAMRKAFMPDGMTVADALYHAADDLAASVTGIKLRPELHILYRAIWHSPVAFSMAGELVSRGWMEAFVLGDTRCGKSAAFKAMAFWYGVGTLLDCKMQTVPGLLGAVEQSAITGERYVLPGIVPLNDGRGPLCFDEFTGPRQNRTTLMEAMSSTRAEGVVRITKAAHASFRSRVRSLWLANPGDGRLLADIPVTGAERFKMLVGQPEDVARFDVAMAVMQQDVPLDILLAPVVLQEPRVPQEMARRLLDWSRSREPSDFMWDDTAVNAVAIATRDMISMYDPSIALVESATQRHKIAKVAATFALCTFSTDNGENVRVTADHVAAAHAFFDEVYGSRAFSYGAYSTRKMVNDVLLNEEELKRSLESMLGDDIVNKLQTMLSTSVLTDRTFGLINGSPLQNVTNTGVGSITYTLHQARCITIEEGDKYRLTRAFIRWAKKYIADHNIVPMRKEATGAN